MLTGILASILASALWAGLHVLWCHAAARATQSRHLIVGWLLSLVSLGAALWMLRTTCSACLPATAWWEDALYAFATQAFVFMLSFIYFGTAERAVTVRLLIEIGEGGPAGITLAGLQERYSTDDMVRRRLADMERGGLVRIENGAWHATDKGVRLTRIMDASAWLYQSAGQHERI